MMKDVWMRIEKGDGRKRRGERLGGDGRRSLKRRG